MSQIKIAKTTEDIAAVKSLFLEYLDVLGTEFDNKVGCANGQEDLQDFPDAYVALFLASLEGEPIAVCGLKRINSSDCELSKLYCKSQGRRHGFGRALTQNAVDYARNLGCKRLVLSTEPVMAQAINLYQDMGFIPIPKYAAEQSGCSKFMGLTL